MDNDFVGMLRCYACGHPAQIVIHKKFLSVAHLHQKTAPGIFCLECAEQLKAGCTILISARPQTQKDEEPYRTGKICVMTPEGAKRLFQNHEKVPPIAFIEDELWERLGLPKGDEDYTDPAESHTEWPSARCQKCGTLRSVRPTWRQHANQSTIQARCLTCQPDQSQEHQLFPHTLELYETHKNDAKTEGGDADPAKVSDPTQGSPQIVDSGPGAETGSRDGGVQPKKTATDQTPAG